MVPGVTNPQWAFQELGAPYPAFPFAPSPGHDLLAKPAKDQNITLGLVGRP